MRLKIACKIIQAMLLDIYTLQPHLLLATLLYCNQYLNCIVNVTLKEIIGLTTNLENYSRKHIFPAKSANPNHRWVQKMSNSKFINNTYNIDNINCVASQSHTSCPWEQLLSLSCCSSSCCCFSLVFVKQLDLGCCHSCCCRGSLTAAQRTPQGVVVGGGGRGRTTGSFFRTKNKVGWYRSDFG